MVNARSVLVAAVFAGFATLPCPVWAQRGAEQVRKESLLRADESLGHDVPDQRGRLGMLRDEELRKHYGRLAELDVLAQIAVKQQDAGLQERVEAVRRKEMQRFHALMLDLRRQLSSKGAR